MASLHLVPFGQPALDRLQEAIAAAKQGDLLRPVTVAVPSNYAKLSLSRTLGALEGGVIGVRFDVLPRVAELLGSPALAAAGRLPLSGAVRAEVVRATLAAAPGIFAEVREHAGTERSLELTFAELRRSPEEALAALERQSERAAHVVRLFREYRRRTEGYYDEEDLALSAAAAVRDGSAALRDIGHVIVFLPRRLSPAEQEMLRALADAGLLTVIIGLTGEEEADGLSRAIASRLEPFLGAAAVEPASPQSARAHVLVAADAEEEVRSVLRLAMRRLEEGAPLHRMAVLYRAAQPYALVAQEQFRAAGVEFNGPGTQTLAQTVAGRALLGLFRVRESGFRRDVVMDWLSSAPILEEEGGQAAPAQRWDALSRAAGVVRGLSQWESRLQAHKRSLEKELADLELLEEASEGRIEGLRLDLEHVERLRSFLRELGRLLEAPAAQGWPDFAAWARRLLDRYLGGEGRLGEWPEREIESYRRILNVLESLVGLRTIRATVDESVFLRAVDRELEATAGREGKFGNGIFLGRISDAVGVDFDVVFVLGMTEGLMPPRDRDDPLLPDDERAAAGEEVPLRSRRRVEERFAYLAALASASERYFVYSRADLRGQRGKLPSEWLLDEASKLEGKTLFASDMDPPPSRDWITVIPSFHGALRDGAEPASPQEYDMRSLLRWSESGRAVLGHYLALGEAALRSGLAAEIARRTARLTVWDGLIEGIEAPGPSRERPASATALETWAACPFRYFLGNVLRVAETEKPEDVLTLSARDRGSLIHAALEQFVRSAAPRKVPDEPWSDDERALLLEIGRRLCDEAEEQGITGKPLLWRMERERILRDLAGFLDADEEMRREMGVVPREVEMGFGMPASAHPALVVPMPGGREVAVRGKIDRVDSTPDGARAAVFDYKSGSANYYSGLKKDPVNRGRVLQLPIYALAAGQCLGFGEAAAYYWFVGEEAGYQRIGYLLDDKALERFQEVAAVIIDGIDSGVFAANPGKPAGDGGHANCRICPYDRVCPVNRRRVWERKRQSPELRRYLEMTEPDERP
ncbi:MAG: PD-(D/E)XK nuclease family protein [Dehalococcoidia bacterium]|nr:PD-(D/E)XK nuclease family protein [Dehalococcoidia bacterium]